MKNRIRAHLLDLEKQLKSAPTLTDELDVCYKFVVYAWFKKAVCIEYLNEVPLFKKYGTFIMEVCEKKQKKKLTDALEVERERKVQTYRIVDKWR